MTKFSTVAQNVTSVNPMLADREYKARSWQMCWKCQQDRPLKGGKMKFYGGGLRKFICKSCVDQKQKTATDLPKT